MLLNFLDQKVIALFGAARFSKKLNLAVFYGNDRLNGKQASRNRNGFGDPPALLEIFQRVEKTEYTELFFLPFENIHNRVDVGALIL